MILFCVGKSGSFWKKWGYCQRLQFSGEAKNSFLAISAVLPAFGQLLATETVKFD